MKTMLIITFFIINFAQAESACRADKLRLSNVAILTDASEKKIVLSTSPENTEMFTELGFQEMSSRLKGHLGGKKIINLFACENKMTINKTFSSKDRRYWFFVYNSCQEQIAKDLGFVPAKIDNYGSMEVGPIVSTSKIGLCTNGKILYHCEPNAQILKCLKEINLNSAL